MFHVAEQTLNALFKNRESKLYSFKMMRTSFVHFESMIQCNYGLNPFSVGYLISRVECLSLEDVPSTLLINCMSVSPE